VALIHFVTEFSKIASDFVESLSLSPRGERDRDD